MNKEVVCALMERGIKDFIHDSVVDWENPQIIGALARTRVAEHLWTNRNFKSTILEQFSLFKEEWDYAVIQVEGIRRRVRATKLAEKDPRYAQLSYQKRELTLTPHVPDRDSKIALIDQQMRNLAGEYDTQK